MGKPFFILFLNMIHLWALGQPLLPIGQWRNHLPMRQVVDIEQEGNEMVVATQFGLYRYAPATKEFRVFTSSQGLSDVRVGMLTQKPATNQYLLAYQNGNMDLIDNESIFNLPDIVRSSLQGNKTIYHGLWQNEDVLLSTGLGIVIVNTTKREIRETISIFGRASAGEVYQLAILGGQLFAATGAGLKKASFPNAALTNPLQWSDELLPMTTGIIKKILTWNDKLVVQKNDSIFVRENGNWKLLNASPAPISSMDVSNGKLLVATKSNKVTVLIFSDTKSSPTLLSTSSAEQPVASLWNNNQLWIGDAEKGLIHLTSTSEEVIVPASPADIAFGRGIYSNGMALATAGSIDVSGNPGLRNAGIFSYDGNNWINYGSRQFPLLDSVKDIAAIAVDPATQTIWAGSYGGGLLEIPKDNKPKIIKYGSGISPALADPLSFRVTGLAIDLQRNLWIANHGAVNPLVLRKNDGSWKKYLLPIVNSGNTLMDIIIDDANRKWILGGPGNGLICFDDAGTPDQTNDDRWRLFKQGRGNGNLPSSNVLSVVSDRNGFIWVGTDRGVALIQCGDDLFKPGICEAILPVVQQDNVAGLLLTNEQINDIKVDGADRKWIATNNGIWLLSADGQKIVYRFTKSNGKLLSNKVRSILLNPENGEVFFFTEDGICSFRSTATEPAAEKQKLFVFPNPVPAGFTGTIAMRNLPSNAWVRIVELDGKLVFQTRSLGGQAIWNGRNYKGERASTGVYLIYVSDENNLQQLAGKIFFIK
ncbi:MAG: hypothetical protein RL282_1874 [Bacteroidota bacterium]